MRINFFGHKKNLLKRSLWIAVSFFVALFSIASEADKTLFVFYPLALRPKEIKTKIETTLPDISITVFARLKDLQAAVSQTPPNAILARPETLKLFPTYSIVAEAVKNGVPVESLVLVSQGIKLAPSNLSGKVIGVIDFSGKKGAIDLVSSIINPPPKLKRVSKIEDLLPLINFNMVVAVLIPKSLVEDATRGSSISIVENEIKSVSVGLLAIGIYDDTGRSIVNSIQKSSDINTLFGVEGWK